MGLKPGDATRQSRGSATQLAIDLCGLGCMDCRGLMALPCRIARRGAAPCRGA